MQQEIYIVQGCTAMAKLDRNERLRTHEPLRPGAQTLCSNPEKSERFCVPKSARGSQRASSVATTGGYPGNLRSCVLTARR
jgi:hypothetical protein